MRIFVTGASGFVGLAVVAELLSGGHRVLGMARSEKSADLIRAAGAEVHRGDIEDFDSLRSGATQSDAVIHLAFNHDFSKFAENCEMDRRAIMSIGSVLAGSDRPLLVTAGLALSAATRPATEDDNPAPHFPRVSEAAADDLATLGVRAATVRLPPSTHGKGDHGFVPLLIQIARERGVSAYVGEGANRWPAAHRLDAARLYRLAIERGAIDGPYHAVAEEGVPFKEIAGVIGRRLDVPVISQSPDEAAQHFGWFAPFAQADLCASSARTRARLNWEPTQSGLIADIDQPYYFAP
jgi:nucleoside-diphosphate-sugar epimerase